MHFEHWFNRLLMPDTMVFVFLIIIVLASIFCGMVVSVVRILRGGGGGNKNDRQALERRNAMIDELWDGMDRMEERINNLETILLSRSDHKL